jgi:hypothetical protein
MEFTVGKTADGAPIRLSVGRDIAHQFVYLTKLAIRDLKPQNWEDWHQPYLEANNVGVEELAQGVLSLANALPNFARMGGGESPEESLRNAGFFDLPKAVQVIIVAKIGQICLGWYFSGIRDCYFLNERCPVAEREAQLYSTAQEVSDLIAKSGTYVSDE